MGVRVGVGVLLGVVVADGRGVGVGVGIRVGRGVLVGEGVGACSDGVGPSMDATSDVAEGNVAVGLGMLVGTIIGVMVGLGWGQPALFDCNFVGAEDVVHVPVPSGHFAIDFVAVKVPE